MTPITRRMPLNKFDLEDSSDETVTSELDETSEPMLAKPRSNKAGLLILFLLAMLFLGSTAYYYRENVKLKNNDLQKAAQESTAELVNKVSKLIILPRGETPVVATVTDPEKLKKEQAFFTNASVGDKILIYTKARKAFMYNPKLNLIIEVAPIVLGDQNNQSQSASQPPLQSEQQSPIGTP